MRTTTLVGLLPILFFSLSSFAQQPNPFGAEQPLAAGTKRHAIVKSERSIKVVYGSSVWNKNPKSIDSATVILREGKTDKLLQIYLEETEPDSAIFAGLFAVRWENVEDLQPEFYVAPVELLGKNSEVVELKKLISEKKISKKPYIFRTVAKQQIIEIYDTGDQARLAFSALQAEKAALQQANKKVVSDATVDAAQLAERVAQSKENAKAELERVRMEQIEGQKLAVRLKENSDLAAAEARRRKEEGLSLSQQAMVAYKAADYKTAEEKFARAMELDPQNGNYYFQYGVTLFKQNELNKAIVFLTLAKETPENAAERSYYLALAYMKLKDHRNALTSFSRAASFKHADISPASEFYSGIILIDEKRLDEAQTAFQRTLDTSRDPKLDKKAEEMIERIQQLKQFEAEKSKKWSATALLGEMYDSDVLLINDAYQTGGKTDLIGYRAVVAGGVKYRPLYDEHREFAVTFDALHMYTVDENFKQKAVLRAADPTLVTLTAPYTIKSVAFNHGNKLDIKPGYEGLMSSQEDDAQKVILHSGFLGLDDTMILNDRTLGTAKAEVRYDSSQLASSVGDNDASALKSKISAGALFFTSPEKTKMILGDLGFTLNAAKGSEVKYNRYDLNIGYIAPWIWDVTYNAKLSYYLLSYPSASANRTDNDFALTLAGSKKINQILTGGLTGTYTVNTSNSDIYKYSKYTIFASLSANWDF